MHNRLFGPRPMLEVILCQYDNDKIFYQFNGMDGPSKPEAVYRLLAQVANALVQPAPIEPAAGPVPDPVSHLLP